MPADALVVFLPTGRRGRFRFGTPVLDAARSLGVDIDSVCGGRGLCGHCQVTLSTGRFAKFGITSLGEHLSPPGELEMNYGRANGLVQGRRLSCAARIVGDAVIDVPPESQLHKQIVRKRATIRDVAVDPLIRLHYLEVPEPTIHDQTADLQRVRHVLRQQWGLEIGEWSLGMLQALPAALRDGASRITVAVRNGHRVSAVWPGFKERVYGLAVDVGTTTLAAHLCELSDGRVVAASGIMNPQTRFGEDVISRVSYIQLNPADGHRLTETVRAAIQELVDGTTGDAGVAPGDILEIALVGNPVMQQLVLGVDPTQLGRTPFALVLDAGMTVRARDLGLSVNADADAYLLPCIAGHVGADTAGVLLSEAPHESDEVMLVVDIGTNAEIVLGSKARLLACSSPTGPAFEGAQISSGQRAALGAIERVRIDPKTLSPRYKVIGCDLWSDDPDFETAVDGIGVTGICGSGIIEAVAEMYLAGVVEPDGRIDPAAAARAPEHVIPDGNVFAYRLRGGERELLVTQTDVRQIQLAKAALYAGIRLLMERLGVERLERIVLAGAFGSYIDPKRAMALGMIPDCELDRVSSAGNAAGAGARIALLSRRARAEIEDLVRRIEKVETAAEPTFQNRFVEAMPIPHSKDPFPILAGSVALPARARPASVAARRNVATARAGKGDRD